MSNSVDDLIDNNWDVVSDKLFSPLVQQLAQRSIEIEKTDPRSSLLLNYAIGSIEVRNCAIQYYREQLSKKNG